MNIRRHKRGGQAIIMVTLALFFMFGIMGLAVDLGWEFFVKKHAQTAADAAALGAVYEAVRLLNGNYTSPCGRNNVDCPANPVSCGSIANSSNLFSGCQYALQNGFSFTGSQNVTMQANQTAPPPTAPGVNDVKYWVTARAVQTVPQLFSGIFGNTQGTVAARATAAIVALSSNNSIYGIGEPGDCVSANANGAADRFCGVNINVGSGGSIRTDGGVVMASTCNGTASPSGCTDTGSATANRAGMSTGSGSVQVQPPAGIKIQGAGTADSGFPGWSNGGGGLMFQDPMRGLTPPPLMASSPVATCGIQGGTISNQTLGPYNYYAYTPGPGGTQVYTGQPITLSGNVTFSSNASCPGVLGGSGAAQGGAFPSYMFYGGVYVNNNTNVTFGPGQYVMVGAPQSSGTAGAVFDTGTGAITLLSSGSGPSYPGNMFIFTAPGYPGLDTQINSFPQPLQDFVNQNLYQGTANFRMGSNLNGVETTLYGYHKVSGPSSLSSYDGVLMWQDRRNTTIQYNNDGTITQSPPQATSSQLLANRVPSKLNSPRILIDTGTRIHLNGVLYQPRGGWMQVGPQGGGWDGDSQLVSGLINMQGTAVLALEVPGQTFTVYKAALVE
jgi:hypothetical protein